MRGINPVLFTAAAVPSAVPTNLRETLPGPRPLADTEPGSAVFLLALKRKGPAFRNARRTGPLRTGGTEGYSSGRDAFLRLFLPILSVAAR